MSTAAETDPCQVTRVCDDVLPELRALAALDPDPKGVSAALQTHSDGQIGHLVG